jgi:predicted transglutaminase-like cysteine proteinase
MIRFAFAAAFAAFATFASSPAAQAGGAESRIAFRTVTSSRTSAAPLAYQLFCLKNESQCKRSSKTKVAHSAALRRKLDAINNAVNRSIRFTNDRSERWSTDVRRGDCEDFALTKRKKLIAAGVPAGALRVAVVRTRKGERHAVLVVKTDRGDLVLDNARRTIVERAHAGYRWISIASNDPSRWVKL